MSPRFALALASLFISISARAEPGSAATSMARSHFQAGVARAEEGDLRAALHEFESAYAAQPHFSVLYNIGQTRATLGRPVEAAAAFELYLTTGGAQISEARRREVEALLAIARSRIGRLNIVLDSNAAEARVWLDGVELEKSAFGTPLPVASGEHTLLYSMRGSPPESRQLSIVANELTEVRLPAAKPTRDAQLLVRCDVPDVQVEIDTMRVTTPIAAPLLVPSGTVTVRFSRAGYATVIRKVSIRSEAMGSVHCAQHPRSPLPQHLSARALVSTTPAGAVVELDGQRYLGTRIPAGRHRLRVQSEGYVAQERDVFLEPGTISTHQIRLSPSPATLARQRQARRQRKTLGIVLGSLGLIAGGTGAGLFVWNSGRYRDWQDQRDPWTGDDVSAATSIQRTDDIAIGFMALGAGLGIGGAWLFFAAD